MTIKGFSTAFAVVIAASLAMAAEATDPTPAEDVDGKYFDAEGIPTFNIADDGTVDWHTYSGFRRYHSECHVCHGPDGEGSTYAPSLRESIASGEIDYDHFFETVVNGREVEGAVGESVMPAFGTNPNVMCYLDDIFVYLRARAQGDLPRGRPAKKEAKSDAFVEAENLCMGT